MKTKNLAVLAIPCATILLTNIFGCRHHSDSASATQDIVATNATGEWVMPRTYFDKGKFAYDIDRALEGAGVDLAKTCVQVVSVSDKAGEQVQGFSVYSRACESSLMANPVFTVGIARENYSIMALGSDNKWNKKIAIGTTGNYPSGAWSQENTHIITSLCNKTAKIDTSGACDLEIRDGKITGLKLKALVAPEVPTWSCSPCRAYSCDSFNTYVSYLYDVYYEGNRFATIGTAKDCYSFGPHRTPGSCEEARSRDSRCQVK